DYHVSRTRSRAVGIHQMAIYTGIILGGFSGYLADEPQLGWRMAFDVTGAIGVAYALPLVYFLRDAPKPARGDGAVVKPTVMSAGKELLSNGAFILLVLYFTLPALAGWVVKDWMPAILKERFGIGQGQAGVSATLYVNLAALGGALLGGW